MWEVATFAVSVLVIKGLMVLFQDDVEKLARFVAREFKEMLQLKPTLRALNAFGMSLLLLVLLVLALANIGDVIPKNDAQTTAELALVQTGARMFYAIMMTAGVIFCVHLTRNERSR